MKQRFADCRSYFLIIIAVLLAALPGGAAKAQIPEEFTNLKVLPQDIPKRELTGMMRGFASALDVRCNHCHVGEDPDSLQGYDFSSDEKETKRTARVMLRMVSAINKEFLPTTERENLVVVRCVTCHRGILRPESIENVLLATIEEEGLDAAVGKYRELREKHFGSGAYDFGSASLDGLTETLAMQKRDAEGAMAINILNLEYNPDSDYALYLHARLLLQAGDRDGAIATLERAIEANPDVGWLKSQLERIQQPPE